MTPRALDAIVIGASAGALDALFVLLPPLPSDYPLPILVVVHLPSDKESILADLLKMKCRIKVREAQDKEAIAAGTAYIAPPDYHLLVEKNRVLSLSNEEPVLFSRPSIDVLFETAADAYRSTLAGVILTGASSDGAKGLSAISGAGGLAIVQRPDRAFASAMPQAALAACPDAESLTLEQIAAWLRGEAVSR